MVAEGFEDVSHLSLNLPPLSSGDDYCKSDKSLGNSDATSFNKQFGMISARSAIKLGSDGWSLMYLPSVSPSCNML